jgi:hypothetical protein
VFKVLNSILCLLFVAGGFACGGTRQTLRESTQSRARNDVSRGVDSARESAESVDGIFTRLRWNPAVCNCPDHELMLYGHWTRCEIGGEETPLAALAAFVKDGAAASPSSFLRVKGQLLDETEERDGRTFCVFEIAVVEEVFSMSKSSP